MIPDVQERLPEYVLGTLSPAEAREMDALVAASPALRREVDLLTEALAGAASTLRPITPSPSLRARILASADRPERPFEPFVAQLAQLFDLTGGAIRALLARIDHPATWHTYAPGIEYQHFPPGPRRAAAAGVEAGLVRLGAGVRFFRHRHLAGSETTFVLQGTMRDGERLAGPGSVTVHEEGTVHDYSASEDGPLVIVVLHHGIEPA
jgi:anti-sigma factor ChrR (cupin superfamily)